MMKDMSKQFIAEKNRNDEKCSTLLVFREMQIENTMQSLNVPG